MADKPIETKTESAIQSSAPNPALTPQQVADGRESFRAKTFPGAPRPEEKKKAKTPPEEIKAGDTGVAEVPKVEEKPVDKQEVKPKPVKPSESEPIGRAPTAKPPKLSDEDVDRVAARTAEALKASEEERRIAMAVENRLTQEADDGLTKKDRERLEALQYIESTDPSRKGLVAQTKQFWKREEAYIEKWKAENPGHKFNPAEEAHAEFYENNEPKVNADELADAERAVLREQITQEVLNKIPKPAADPRVAKMEYEQKKKDLQPVLHKTAGTAILAMIEQADQEMDADGKPVPGAIAKLLEVDGKKVLSREVADAIKAHDPVAYEILDRNAEHLRILATEAVKLNALWEHYHPDVTETVELVSTRTDPAIEGSGQIIRPHAELIQFAIDLDNKLSTAPKEAMMRGDKAFISQAGRKAKIDDIIENTKDPKQRTARLRSVDETYWTLEPDDIQAALVEEFAYRSKKEIETVNRRADAKLKAKGPPGTQPSTEQPKSKLPFAQADDDDHQSPSLAQASDRTDTSKGKNQTSGLTSENFRGTMWK